MSQRTVSVREPAGHAPSLVSRRGSYRLEVSHGHLIGYFPQGPELIDTGAPVSVTPSEELQRLIGAKVRRITGLDRLNGEVLAFNTQAGTVECEPEWEGGADIRLRRHFGVPIIPISWAGSATRAVLDTGAQLSYAPKEVVRTGRDYEVRWDFCPGIAPHLGQYEVETARITVQIGGRPVDLRVALHPPAVRQLISAVGLPDWIVGAELFTRGRVILDLRRDVLVLQ